MKNELSSSSLGRFIVLSSVPILISDGGKGGKGRASAPGGTVKGAHLEGQKYRILKFGRFWRIGVFIAVRIQRVR